MYEQYNIEYQNLLNNPTTRVPICLCLDVSGSMQNDGKIDALNRGLREFIDVLYEDEIARDSAELCIIAVGDREPRLICNYKTIDELKSDNSIGNFIASGLTPLGHAVHIAIQCLNDRKELYKETDTDYYQPWLVIMSDGAPTDEKEVNETLHIIRKMINDRKLYSLSVLIGEYAEGADLLGKYATLGRAVRLHEVKMGTFFKWLSASVSKITQSMPGTELDPFADDYGLFELK